jgi:hypothetical protein
MMIRKYLLLYPIFLLKMNLLKLLYYYQIIKTTFIGH